MKHVFIIAEAGVNHNGNPELAKKLIEAAADAGADAVKFQTFVPELIVSRYAGKADYQKASTDSGESQLEMLRKLALSREDHKELIEHAKNLGIQFISTPFDLESINFLDSLGIPFFKVPSGEITNLPYLEKIAGLGKPVVLSTGMSTIDEIRDAMKILESGDCHDISILHCNTEYPTPYKDVNLSAMDTLRQEFGVTVGYSDHTLGIEVPVAAVAMGAEIIEKHFTLDRNMEGPDHKASLIPDELKAMVKAIRNIELAIGDPEKKVSESERKNIAIARKSIVAKRDIQKGENLTSYNITVKRPGNGISPMKWYEVIGTKAIRDFEEDELIEI
ncbi:N-acetylneuraminate synthase [Lachnospiraceae bacterium XBB2008]|nr:N-acetylneuraminate synthase [Lachnospiraceae bacterium XBB2008]